MIAMIILVRGFRVVPTITSLMLVLRQTNHVAGRQWIAIGNSNSTHSKYKHTKVTLRGNCFGTHFLAWQQSVGAWQTEEVGKTRAAAPATRPCGACFDARDSIDLKRIFGNAARARTALAAIKNLSTHQWNLKLHCTMWYLDIENHKTKLRHHATSSDDQGKTQRQAQSSKKLQLIRLLLIFKYLNRYQPKINTQTFLNYTLDSRMM